MLSFTSYKNCSTINTIRQVSVLRREKGVRSVKVSIVFAQSKKKRTKTPLQTARFCKVTVSSISAKQQLTLASRGIE